METAMGRSFAAAAYGGEGWQARQRTHREELGSHWAACGQNSEWAPLKSVLLHAPGEEILPEGDVNAALQLGQLDLAKAQTEHAQLVSAYRDAGISVHLLEPGTTVAPNQMFCADLLFMTDQGAILARPASEQRAGEERHVASRISQLGIPILKTLTGNAVFEGADAAWLDPKTVV
ncbi:MAG: arginine deiminase-related protein, partial [Pseudomonadota bacterium]